MRALRDLLRLMTLILRIQTKSEDWNSQILTIFACITKLIICFCVHYKYRIGFCFSSTKSFLRFEVMSISQVISKDMSGLTRVNDKVPVVFRNTPTHKWRDREWDEPGEFRIVGQFGARFGPVGTRQVMRDSHTEWCNMAGANPNGLVDVIADGTGDSEIYRCPNKTCDETMRVDYLPNEDNTRGPVGIISKPALCLCMHRQMQGMKRNQAANFNVLFTQSFQTPEHAVYAYVLFLKKGLTNLEITVEKYSQFPGGHYSERVFKLSGQEGTREEEKEDNKENSEKPKEGSNEIGNQETLPTKDDLVVFLLTFGLINKSIKWQTSKIRVFKNKNGSFQLEWPFNPRNWIQLRQCDYCSHENPPVTCKTAATYDDDGYNTQYDLPDKYTLMFAIYQDANGKPINHETEEGETNESEFSLSRTVCYNCLDELCHWDNYCCGNRCNYINESRCTCKYESCNDCKYCPRLEEVLLLTPLDGLMIVKAPQGKVFYGNRAITSDSAQQSTESFYNRYLRNWYEDLLKVPDILLLVQNVKGRLLVMMERTNDEIETMNGQTITLQSLVDELSSCMSNLRHFQSFMNRKKTHVAMAFLFEPDAPFPTQFLNLDSVYYELVLETNVHVILKERARFGKWNIIDKILSLHKYQLEMLMAF